MAYINVNYTPFICTGYDDTGAEFPARKNGVQTSHTVSVIPV